MTQVVERYHVRFAQTEAEIEACQRLRHRCFFGGVGIDADLFDPLSDHLMVIGATGALLSTVRLRVTTGAKAKNGYTGQFYNLASFGAWVNPVMELGRMCCAATVEDPMVLRMLWGALSVVCDRKDVRVVFGCSSFEGLFPKVHADSFRKLYERHLAPRGYGSFRKAADTVSLDSVQADSAAQQPMPPMLRTYLAMGGWVSDHAVVDRDFCTLHVLTGLEIAKVPPRRAAVLRTLGKASGLTFDCADRSLTVG